MSDLNELETNTEDKKESKQDTYISILKAFKIIDEPDDSKMTEEDMDRLIYEKFSEIIQNHLKREK